MGQALSFCKECFFTRDCDVCQELHDWIMEALEEKAELQAYRDTGLEPDEVREMKADVEAGYLKQAASGHWIEYMRVVIPAPYNKWEQAWKCSECGFDDGFVAYNYCPNCGVRMEPEEDGK